VGAASLCCSNMARSCHVPSALPRVTLARVTMRVVWGLCLVVAAMTTAIGFELYGDGAGRAISYPIVLTGVLLPVLASAVIRRLVPSPSSPPEGF